MRFPRWDDREHVGNPHLFPIFFAAIWVGASDDARVDVGLVQPATMVSRADGRTQRMFVEWLVQTVFGSTLFLVVTNSWEADARVPIAYCIGLPAFMFGIRQLVHFAREG